MKARNASGLGAADLNEDRNNDMKTIKTLGRLALLAFALPAAFPALAQDSYGYVGGAVGASRARIDEPRISAALLGAGATNTSIVSDNRDTAFRLFGGYQLNRYVALEGGYFSLGKFGFTSTTVPAGTLSGEMKVQGGELDLVASLPLGDRFSLLGRVGGTYARTRDRFAGTGAVTVFNPSPSKRAGNVTFGGGLQYEVNRSFLVRAEAQRYRVDDAVGNKGDVNVISLALVFPFGRTAPAAKAMAAPVYVSAAPPPPVTPQPPPPPPPPPPPVAYVAPPAAVAPVAVVAPERRRVSFSADSLFTFDQSKLHTEGRQALDRFSRELAGTRFDVVTVEGHTDRLGTEAYNMALSARRADTVKAYLVSSGGLDAAKLKAVAKGETEPVTKPGQCVGGKPTPRLIACLQPDRRVEVEVAGTR